MFDCSKGVYLMEKLIVLKCFRFLLPVLVNLVGFINPSKFGWIYKSQLDNENESLR